MKPTLPLLVWALLIQAINIAHARIGETEQQIIARYGKSIKDIPSKGAREKYGAFVFNGFTIIVVFLDGVSQAESYSKDRDGEFSNDEIAALLKANAPAASWKLKASTPPAKLQWEAKIDKFTVFAIYSKKPSGYSLIFGTTDYAKYMVNSLE